MKTIYSELSIAQNEWLQIGAIATGILFMGPKVVAERMASSGVPMEKVLFALATIPSNLVPKS